MALTAYSGTIDASVINGNFDDEMTELLLQRIKRFYTAVSHIWKNVDDGTATVLLDRIFEFTPNDDIDLRAVRIYVQTNSGPDDITVTMTCPGNDHYLLKRTYTFTLDGSVDANHHTTDEMQASSGDNKVTLKKGVTYRLTVANSDTTSIALIQVSLLGTQKRRRR